MADSLANRVALTTLELTLPALAGVSLAVAWMQLTLTAGPFRLGLALASVLYSAALAGLYIGFRRGLVAEQKSQLLCAAVAGLSLAHAALYFWLTSHALTVLPALVIGLGSVFLVLSVKGFGWIVATAIVLWLFLSSAGLPPAQRVSAGAIAITSAILWFAVWRGRVSAYRRWHEESRGEMDAMREGLEKQHREELERVSQAADPKRILEAHGETDGLWEWNMKTDQVYFSPRWRALLGYGDSSFTGTPETWFNLVHPYDLDELMKRLRSHLEGETAFFEYEHRIRQADGSYRWVLSHGRIVRGPKGEAERLAGSQIDIGRLKNYEAELIYQATHDRLTGLPNRESALERLEEEIQRKKRNEGYLFALAFIDLDGFKYVNDTLGHAVGDELLKLVAKRLKQAVRQQDFVARLGGDEFVALLRPVKDEKEAVHIASRIDKTLKSSFRIQGNEVTPGASIGVAVCSSHSLNGEDILRNADIAMYHAKRQGKGRIKLFDPEMGWQTSRHFALQNALKRASENNELELFYQPIVCLQSGKIVAAEALMRWRRSDGELVYPSEFIPLAEEMDLISDLGRWAIEEACRQQRRWLEAGLGPLKQSVNLSARQLNEPGLLDTVKLALRMEQLTSSSLQLEITESAVCDTHSRAAESLERLTLLGISMAIDDFGTGYSSLSYLRTLCCSVLKIDRSFVSEISSDPKSAAIVRSIISLAHNLNLEVVAEGVETYDQLEFLRRYGCNAVQGFFASRPLPAHEFERLLRSNWQLPGDDPALSSAAAEPEAEAPATEERLVAL